MKRIDILADLEDADAAFLHELLPAAFYVRLADIQAALAAKTAIMYYHLPSLFTVMKIDIFILKLRAFDQDELQHIQYLPLKDGERTFPVAAPFLHFQPE